MTSNKKYAICIFGQSRAINTIRDNFYKNFADVLDADIFICVQNNKNIHKLDKRIKELVIYDNPENIKDKYLNHKLDNNNDNDTTLYKNDNHLRVYYNLYLINEKFGKVLEQNYDYVIVSRSDYLHLVPYPDVITLSNINNVVWIYDGHDWGGINNTCICIPSAYIREYLTCRYRFLNDMNSINSIRVGLNEEAFLKYIFIKNNWKVGKIELNAVLTADDHTELTTWAPIKYSEPHKVYYKYEEQLIKAHELLNKYNMSYKWS
jgi:hypothetical protein